MRIFAIIAAVALCASAANAIELENISAGNVTAFKMELPVPVLRKSETENKCGHISASITNLYLLAQTAKSQIVTVADTEAQFTEFVNMWTPMLAKFDIKVIGTEYKSRVGIVKYEAPGGRVLRSFIAEKMHYDALDPAAIKKLEHELLEPLEQAGMTPVASIGINHPAFRPTFVLYYLTKPQEKQESEIQLRQMANGEDIDFDLLTSYVTLVKKDAVYSMVYIGKALGYKSKVSATEDGVNQKVADFKKLLIENKMEFLTAKVFKLDPPFVVGTTTYNYAANIYFYQ